LRAPSPPLADDAIRLDPLDERFIPDFELLVLDPDVVRNTRVPSRPPNGFAVKWIGRYTRGWADGVVCRVRDPRRGELLPRLRRDRRPRSFRPAGGDRVRRRAGARGRGVAGRALRLLSDWAIEGLGLERVELRIDVANDPSIRVAERAGYRREGVLRSLHFKEEIRGDVAVYSLLRRDTR
jgi:hypothetical protein